MNKNLFSSLLVLSLLFPYNSFGADFSPCNDVSGYDLYECRKEYLCGEKSGRKPAKFIYDTSSQENLYLELEPGDTTYLSRNKQKYRDNMNNLYKCALIQVQLNALGYIKGLEKDPDIESRINTKLDQRIQSLEQRKGICSNIDDMSIYNKQTVLQQSNYEICKYINYLDYLDYYTDTLGNTIEAQQEQSVLEVSTTQQRAKAEIQQELDHVIKVFPLAYTAYSQYENNFTIHLVLELIREDFLILRKRLHAVLGPISQLVYKANNSMTKGN